MNKKEDGFKAWMIPALIGCLDIVASIFTLQEIYALWGIGLLIGALLLKD